MIASSERFAAAVRAGGVQLVYVADVISDGVRVLSDVPLSDLELTWNGDQKVRGTGRCVLHYSDNLGGSIVPTDLSSWVTPYATVLNISARVSAGDFTEKLLLGPLKVVRVTDPTDFRRPFLGGTISLGSSVGLQLADLFRVTDKERFPAPYGPIDLGSVWSELARLTALPLSRNVDDTAITSSITYKENRLDAVFDLAKLLGGTPYVDEFGRVTLDPDEWPEPSEELASGADGVIISRLPADLTDEGIYNQVVVRSENVVLATREVQEGILRYGGVFGRVPYFASSQYVTTVEQADAYAESELAKVSQLPAVQFTLEAVPDPRRQVGDVIPFQWDERSYLGRVREVRLGSSGPMKLRVIGQDLGPVVTVERVFPGSAVFPSLSLYPV